MSGQVKYYGTLELVKETKTIIDDDASYSEWQDLDGDGHREPPIKGYYTEQYWRITGAQPAIMANRIMDHKWGASTNTVNIDDTLAHVKYIDWLMKLYPLEIKKDSMFFWRKRMGDLREFEESRAKIAVLEYVSPNARTFKGTLMDFQQQGLDFLLKKKGRALLADEMGLGKTPQSLAFVATAEDTLPAVIVGPLVTLINWKREIHKFVAVERINEVGKKGAISLRKEVSTVEPKIEVIRSGKRGVLPKADFYVINYDLLGKRREDLMAVNPHTIIADECQHLRNYTTIKYQAMKEMAAISSVIYRLGLSGTPIYNRGAEVWPICDWIEPGVLGSHADFVNLYCHELDPRRVLADRRQALYEVLSQNLMLRRKKTEVLKDLPEKVRHKEVIEVDVSYYQKELTAALKRYDEALGKAVTHFDKVKAFQSLKGNERQIAGIAKIPAVIDFVKEVLDNDESVVVFCHHLAVHESLNRHLSEFNPASIVGGQSDKERQENIDKFQKQETQLMIAGLRAGNVGIALTAAPYVIFGELDWTPSIHAQAEDRLHRIGQKQRVFAYYLEGKDTLDEKVVGVLIDKTLEINQVMGDNERPDELAEDNEEKAAEILSMMRKKARR